MKIAIVHDYIKEYGGAERVLLELHKLYPDAPIYTSLYVPEYLGPHKEEFKNMRVKTSFLNYIPLREKLISVFRLLAPLAFMSMDLGRYDVIIVSQTGAYFPNLVRKGKAKLITYTHTPPRYLYGYMTARDWQKDKLMRFAGHIVNHFLRMVDFKASQNVDQFVANSEEIRARIQKFYRKDAVVINPPVDIPEKGKAGKREFYVAGGRLARAKGIDVILDAFMDSGKSIKIFGKGFAGFEEELIEKVKGRRSKIEFVGEITDEEKVNLLRSAKAYIFAAFDEDFGITPVEAMAAGAPVVAFRSGGVQETVVDEKTGIFYDKNTGDDLNGAINKLEKTKISEEACRKQAEKFAPEIFDKKIKSLVERIENA